MKKSIILLIFLFLVVSIVHAGESILILSRQNYVLNKIPVLLLHSNGVDEATTFPDSSPSNHTVSSAFTAQVDTAQKKWGSASCLLDGNSDYLSIPDSADWDISTNWTIDLWVKHVDHDGTEDYVNQFEDGTNYWKFDHRHGTGLEFIMLSGGATIVTLDSGEITDTNWHHAALCKVGNEYGLYLDGIQTGFVDDASMDTFAGTLYIGAVGAPGDYHSGHLDEIRITKTNVFNAAPVNGLTDTITVPTRQYISWR